MPTDPHPGNLISSRLFAKLESRGDLDELVPLTRALADAGVRISVWTALRWARTGSRGIRLEALKVGGRWLTSRRCVAEFLTAQGPSRDRRPPVVHRRPETEAILERHGLGRGRGGPDSSA